ncbi:MAG: hypothetical protein H5T86_04015 [Armatimonadetes bacterium]|nr:hypothetical protein [Armatimonadota bacterium]
MGACGRDAALAAPQPEIFENAHYSAVIDPNRGGMLSLLKSKATGEILIDNMRIYTDVGVLVDDRYGYVGTGEGSCERFDAKREAEALVTEAEGKLVGAAAEGKPPIFYRCQMRFDQTPTITLTAAIRPSETKEAGGFLALSWYMPAMAAWTVRTIDGLLRHVVRPGEEKAGRSYSRQWPVDPERPMLLFRSDRGAGLRIDGLSASGDPVLTGPVIHGKAVFLCWIDGAPRRLVAGQRSVLQFALTVAGP